LGFHKLVELAQEFVGAELVGIIGIEVGKLRIVVVAQPRLRRTHALELWNRPRPRARAAAWIADVRRQWITLLDFGRSTNRRRGRQRTFFRRPHLHFGRLRVLALAPHGGDELSVDAIAEAAVGEVIPEETGAGVIDVGDSLLERKLFGDGAAGVVGSLFAAIADGPRLLVVVGGSRSSRPDVAVAGDLSAVVEIVEHSELERELVLVGSDVFAIHRQ